MKLEEVFLSHEDDEVLS